MIFIFFVLCMYVYVCVCVYIYMCVCAVCVLCYVCVYAGLPMINRQRRIWRRLLFPAEYALHSRIRTKSISQDFRKHSEYKLKSSLDPRGILATLTPQPSSPFSPGPVPVSPNKRSLLKTPTSTSRSKKSPYHGLERLRIRKKSLTSLAQFKSRSNSDVSSSLVGRNPIRYLGIVRGMFQCIRDIVQKKTNVCRIQPTTSSAERKTRIANSRIARHISKTRVIVIEGRVGEVYTVYVCTAFCLKFISISSS